MKVLFSRAARKAYVTVRAESPRSINEVLAAKFGHELKGLGGNPDTLFFAGIENFSVGGLTSAAALEVLVKAPEVYRGTFVVLSPDYGRQPSTREFTEAAEALRETAADYGRGVSERADKIRAGLIDSAEKLTALATRLVHAPALALDLETFPLPEVKFNAARDIGDTRKSEVRLLSLATPDGETALIDCSALGRRALSAALKPLLERVPILGHGLQYEWAFLLDHYGIELGRRDGNKPGPELWDTLLAARVLSNEAPLTVWANRYDEIVEAVGECLEGSEFPIGEEEEEEDNDEGGVIPSGGKGKKKRLVFAGDRDRTVNTLDKLLKRFLGLEPGPDMSVSDWSRDELSDRQLIYAVEDVAPLFRLKEAILASADEEDRRIIDLDLAVLRVCLDAYKSGLPIDRERLEHQLRVRGEALLAAKQAASIVFPNTDFSSPKACLRALGEVSIYLESVEKRSLRAYREDPRVAVMIRVRNLLAEVRDLETKFRDHLRPDGAIHGRILPEGTGTGRCSSKQPNLQNVKRPPEEEELAADPGLTDFRALVRAPAGWKIIKADSNQMELRGCAVVSGDEAMLEEYRKPTGADLHDRTARQFTPELDTLAKTAKACYREARRKAKLQNFGLCYGMQVSGFLDYAIKNYGIKLSREEAEEMREEFFELYEGLAEWHAQARFDARHYPPYGTTLYGRKRRLHPLSEDLGEWWAGFQALTNHVVQGSCADAMKIAMVELFAKLDPDEARILSSIHDELLVLAREDVAARVAQLVADTMREAAAKVFGRQIPFPAEPSIGRSWAGDTEATSAEVPALVSVPSSPRQARSAKLARRTNPKPSGVSREAITALYAEARARGIPLTAEPSKLDWPPEIAKLGPLTNLEEKFRWEKGGWAIWQARQQGIPLGSLNGAVNPIQLQYCFCYPSRVLDSISQLTVNFAHQAKDLQQMLEWTLMLKVFNDPAPFNMLYDIVGGMPTAANLDAEYCWQKLTEAQDRGDLARLWRPAYLVGGEGHKTLFTSAVQIIKDGIADQLVACTDLYQCVDLLRAYPGVGPFHASQMTIDLSYSDFLKGKLEDFVWAGPGACKGVGLWFQPHAWSWAAVNHTLRLLTQHQEYCYQLVNGEPAPRLQGRLAFAQDVQNHACETQKYLLRSDTLRLYRGDGGRQNPPLLPRWW
jgi:DNA polymerase-1